MPRNVNGGLTLRPPPWYNGSKSAQDRRKGRNGMQRTTDMTVGSPVKLLLTFSLPLILTNLGQQLYMIVDGAIVGRGVGVNALAAVGATDWIYWMILWAVLGLTQGFATFVARHYGENDYEAVNRTIATSAILCAVISLVLTAAGILSAEPLLLLLDTPEEILPDAKIYLITMIAGTLVVGAYNMAASILRAFGDGRSPLVGMAIAGCLNVGLDLLFVMVLHLGVFGAAFASVLSQGVAFVYCLIRILRVDCVHLTAAHFRPERKRIGELLLFGLPLAFQNVVIALGGIIVQSSINAEGSIFLAGYTATNKLYGLLESSAISLGIAASTFLSQNYGAGLYRRVRDGVKKCTGIVLIMAVAVAAIIRLAGHYLLQLFLDVDKAGGAEALVISEHYLGILAWCLCILYLLHVYRNGLQAIGVSVWSMLSGFAEFAARVCMAKFGFGLFGTDALLLAEPAAWLAALLFVMIPYFFYQKSRLPLQS